MKKKPVQKKREENPIHVMLTSNEAIEGKKDLLNSEVSLLKIYENISNYRELRLNELKKKSLIIKKFSEINRNLNLLQKILPELRFPKILQKENEEKFSEERIPVKTPKTRGNIQSQLEEIQEKLKALEGMS